MTKTLPTLRLTDRTVVALCASLLVTVAAMAGCGGDKTIVDPPQETGTLEVTTTTDGVLPDPNGYTLSVDGQPQGSIGVSATREVSAVDAGNHTVELGGIEDNCRVTNGNESRSVSVRGNQTTAVSFDLDCGVPDIAQAVIDALCIQSSGQAIDVSDSTLVGSVANALSSGDCDSSGGQPTVSGNFFETWRIFVTADGIHEITATPSATAAFDLVLQVLRLDDAQQVDTVPVAASDQGGTSIAENLALLLRAIGSGGSSSVVGAGDGVLLSASTEYLVKVSGLTAAETGTYSLEVKPTTSPPDPAPATIQVSTVTTGGSPDPDGYVVTVGGKSKPIATTGTASFVGLDAGSYTVTLGGLASNCTVPNPSQTLNAAAGQTATVTFAVDCAGSSTLTVEGGGSGNGTVTSQPAGINCTITGTSESGTCSFDFNDGTQVTLTASASGGSSFSGWSGGGCSGTSPCTVTMNQARTVTATFNTVQRPLTVQGGGNGNGTVTSQPAGINCTITGTSESGTCSFDFNDGTQVTLTASASGGSSFSGWSGGGCSGTSPCTVTMDQARTVTATFTQSSPTISNLTDSVGSINTCNTGSGVGSDIDYSFDYVDPDGDVLTGVTGTLDFVFNPVGGSGSIPLVIDQITGSGFQGSVLFDVCVLFNAATSVTVTVRLTDLGGNQSNSTTITTPRPPGANVQGLSGALEANP